MTGWIRAYVGPGCGKRKIKLIMGGFGGKGGQSPGVPGR